MPCFLPKHFKKGLTEIKLDIFHLIDQTSTYTAESQVSREVGTTAVNSIILSPEYDLLRSFLLEKLYKDSICFKWVFNFYLITIFFCLTLKYVSIEIYKPMVSIYYSYVHFRTFSFFNFQVLVYVKTWCDPFLMVLISRQIFHQ